MSTFPKWSYSASRLFSFGQVIMVLCVACLLKIPWTFANLICEAKYNLWKLGSKLNNNTFPPHFLHFFKKKKKAPLKKDFPTNMCQTSPCKVLLPQVHTWRNINTRFTTQGILWKRTSRGTLLLPQISTGSPFVSWPQFVTLGYINRIHLDFLGQSLSHIPFPPPYGCHTYNEMWLNCYKFLRLCEYK